MQAHIREKIRPRGGNDRYRDRAERKTSTLCGEPVTEFDWTLREATAKKNRSAALLNLCSACVEKALGV
jgi:hypothetical protein